MCLTQIVEKGYRLDTGLVTGGRSLKSFPLLALLLLDKPSQ